jgi:hypothetical protein
MSWMRALRKPWLMRAGRLRGTRAVIPVIHKAMTCANSFVIFGALAETAPRTETVLGHLSWKIRPSGAMGIRTQTSCMPCGSGTSIYVRHSRMWSLLPARTVWVSRGESEGGWIRWLPFLAPRASRTGRRPIIAFTIKEYARTAEPAAQRSRQADDHERATAPGPGDLTSGSRSPPARVMVSTLAARQRRRSRYAMCGHDDFPNGR